MANIVLNADDRINDSKSSSAMETSLFAKIRCVAFNKALTKGMKTVDGVASNRSRNIANNPENDTDRDVKTSVPNSRICLSISQYVIEEVGNTSRNIKESFIVPID